jgi:hypothetical protein
LLAAGVIGALVALGSGAVAVALVRDNDDNPKAAPATVASTTAAPTTQSTEPPTTASTEPPTTATTATPTTVTTVVPPPPPTPPPTRATTPPRPRVAITGPTRVENNGSYVWRTTSSDATSGQWSVSGGPSFSLSNTAWRPGGSFSVRPGCGAVGSTYQLMLTVRGPGGTSSATLPVTVIDSDGSCS